MGRRLLTALVLASFCLMLLGGCGGGTDVKTPSSTPPAPDKEMQKKSPKNQNTN